MSIVAVRDCWEMHYCLGKAYIMCVEFLPFDCNSPISPVATRLMPEYYGVILPSLRLVWRVTLSGKNRTAVYVQGHARFCRGQHPLMQKHLFYLMEEPDWVKIISSLKQDCCQPSANKIIW